MAFRKRDEGMRKILLFIIGIRVSASLSANYTNYLLFTERVFGWNVVQYTTFTSVFMGLYVVKTFVTTPVYSYLLGMHDAMLAIIGALVGVGTTLVQVSLIHSLTPLFISFYMMTHSTFIPGFFH